MKITLKKYPYFVPMMIHMIVIFYFSAQPAVESAKISGGVLQVVLNFFVSPFPATSGDEQQILLAQMEHIIRKSAHFCEYALLAMLCFFAFKEFFVSAFSKILASLLVCLLYAASDEIHQLFVLGRSAQVRDVVIDFCGAVTGIGVIFLVKVLAIRKSGY